ncbi:unnamed protein product [Periconia digitata]|uniref:Ubiquitin-like domain-containing protein n=1 Tax=Periconia digitata TaxID=1303443 RepID=A0A9W4UIS2_9PLEO|nr:unnamed protein product [Periconia digitata]
MADSSSGSDSDSTSSAQSSTTKVGTLNLRILSPSAEVEGGGITFTALPSATTIAELKSKIQDAVPSKPTVDRMRLIYRGRVVANPYDALLTIFGADTIAHSPDQSLHLVLRELPSSSSSSPAPAPRVSTAPPHPAGPSGLPDPPQNPLATNPFRNLAPPGQQPVPNRPNSQPPPPPHYHHHPHHHHHHHHQPPNMGLPIALPPLVQQLYNQAQQQPEQPRNENNESGDGASNSNTNPPPPASRIVRQEGIGPNGERWSVTWNNTQVTVPLQANQQPPLIPRAFRPPPPGFGLPGQPMPAPRLAVPPVMTLARLQRGQQLDRQRLENARLLLSTPVLSASVTRLDQARRYLDEVTSSLDNADRSIAELVSDPSMAQHRDLVSLQQSLAQLRRRAEESRQVLTTRLTALSPNSPLSSTAAQAPNNSTPSSSVPPELFILSSPQGPVGLVFDQRGSYVTAPIVPTTSFHSFNQQFEQNRQVLAGMGQRIAESAIANPILSGMAPSAQNQQQQPGQPAPAADVNAAGIANANANPNGNANGDGNVNNAVPPLAAAAAAAQDNDRANVIAGHLWLLFKLAMFIYFFAGGGSWYRPVMMGLIGVVVYLGQMGIFDTQFNRLRQHFEAILPLGDLAAGPNNNNNNENNNNANPTPADAQPAAQQHHHTNPPNPEDAARRLLNQQQEQHASWIRESIRAAERGFALFVASLLPGVGERMVQAQEERARAERAAEEERRAREEREASERDADKDKETNGEKSKTDGDVESSSAVVHGAAERDGEPSSSSTSFPPDDKGKGRAAEVES